MRGLLVSLMNHQTGGQSGGPPIHTPFNQFAENGGEKGGVKVRNKFHIYSPKVKKNKVGGAGSMGLLKNSVLIFKNSNLGYTKFAGWFFQLFILLRKMPFIHQVMALN